jgi:hypothetical protein
MPKLRFASQPMRFRPRKLTAATSQLLTSRHCARMTDKWTSGRACMFSENHIRQVELSRVQALLSRDMELAWKLHSPSYQLITPAGRALSRERYLGKIAAGELTYLQWKPEHIHVRLAERMAIVRYRATLELDAGEGHGTPFECWHTDTYELNEGEWQAVWSQATKINSSD